MLAHAAARPVGDWLAMLDQVEASIVHSLTDAERQAEEWSEAEEATAHRVAARAKKFQNKLTKRLEELSASLAQASETARAAGEELLGAEEDVCRWVGSVAELRTKFAAMVATAAAEA